MLCRDSLIATLDGIALIASDSGEEDTAIILRELIRSMHRNREDRLREIVVCHGKAEILVRLEWPDEIIVR